MTRPFILTLQLDQKSDVYFQDMRQQHFPPALNIVPAHITLFHQLPASEERAVFRALGEAVVKRAPFKFRVSGLRRLGRGVAYEIDGDELISLRAELAERFADYLVQQDKQKFRPHVTIQNKVSPARASGLFEHLSAGFVPFAGVAEGLQLWRYEGGPWQPVAAFPFQSSA